MNHKTQLTDTGGIYIISPPKRPAMAILAAIRPHRISPRASRPALASEVSVEEAAVSVLEAVPEGAHVPVAVAISPPPVDRGAVLSSASSAALAKFS